MGQAREHAFSRGQRRLKKLLKKAEAGDIYLCYYDEPAFFSNRMYGTSCG